MKKKATSGKALLLFLCPNYKNNDRFLDTQKTICLSPLKHPITHSNYLHKIDPTTLSFLVNIYIDNLYNMLYCCFTKHERLKTKELKI